MVHSGQKRNPFCIPFIDKWYLGFVYFIYFATQIVQRKKDKKSTKQKKDTSIFIHSPD